MTTSEANRHLLAQFRTESLAHLVVITADLQWCFADGYQPRSGSPTNHGSARKADATPASSPDHVPAAKWDTGQASYRARRSFERACEHLGIAEARMAGVLWAAAVAQPAMVLPDGTQLRSALRCVAALETRLDLLTLHQDGLAPLPGRDVNWCQWLAGQPPGRKPSAVEALYLARMALHRAFQDGQLMGANVSPTIWCKVCGLREAHRAGRCATCRQYKSRNGHERPIALDMGRSSVADARVTQARHRAMGEGYGFN